MNEPKSLKKQKTPWFVYIAACKDRSYYIGISNDVKRRIEKHNSGKSAKYLRGNPPIILLYTEKHSNKSQARKREMQLKKWSRKKKEWLIGKGSLTVI